MINHRFRLEKTFQEILYMIDTWINNGSGWIIFFKCFLWCHVRHINPLKEHPGIIKKTDKQIARKLDYDGIEFPVQEKDFSKIEVKNNICINVFGYENKLAFPIYISEQKFEDPVDLLLLNNDNKSHYV